MIENFWSLKFEEKNIYFRGTKMKNIEIKNIFNLYQNTLFIFQPKLISCGKNWMWYIIKEVIFEQSFEITLVTISFFFIGKK